MHRIEKIGREKDVCVPRDNFFHWFNAILSCVDLVTLSAVLDKPRAMLFMKLAADTLLLLLLVALLNQTSATNEVIGCGGFIKSNTEINYKIIKVKLLTKDGAVKYTTEASPVNGYYMIPIYNKGDYVLQVNPPLGWSFGR